MKILHLTTVASSFRYLLLPQLIALRDAGHDVVAVSADGPDVAALREEGIRHRFLAGSTRGFDLRADAEAIRSFVRIVKDERPDLVHTHNPKPGLYGRIASRLLGVPHVVNTVHGLYATPDDPFRRRALVYGLEAVATRFSHLELVQSIEDVDLMCRTPLAPSERVRHLGNGIDTRLFTPLDDPTTRASIREDLGLAADSLIIGAIGRLVAEKGFGELFAASAALDVPHELVVIGPHDPEKSDALSAAVVADAERRGVRFLGHRDDIHRLLPAFDIFALPSYREGVPRAAMEAAASGLPIVATDVRGCRQVVDDGTSGLLVPARESQPLTVALRRLIDDPYMRSRFGKEGRKKAELEFDEKDVVRRLLEAYAELGVSSSPTRTVDD